MKANAERYRKFQNFNFITKLLHSVRYNYTLNFIDSLNYDKTKPLKILEIGCADGQLFGLLDQHYCIEYTGIELFADFASVAQKKHGHKANFNLIHGSVMNCLDNIVNTEYDLIISLETLEHIPWTEVITLLQSLSHSQCKHFLFSIPNEIGPAVLIKNIGSFIMRYPRYREYSWRHTWYAGFYRLDQLPRHHINHIGFDWRWIVQLIRYNFRILKIKKSPFKFIPSYLSPSFFIICTPNPG